MKTQLVNFSSWNKKISCFPLFVLFVSVLCQFYVRCMSIFTKETSSWGLFRVWIVVIAPKRYKTQLVWLIDIYIRVISTDPAWINWNLLLDRISVLLVTHSVLKLGTPPQFKKIHFFGEIGARWQAVPIAYPPNRPGKL